MKETPAGPHESHPVAINLAADRDLAGVGLEDAAQNLDQRRFAGDVFAEQRHHFAAVNVQADALKRPRRPERLHDVLE